MFFSLLNKEITFATWSLSGISVGQYCQKTLAKSGEFGKNIKRGDGPIGEVVYRRWYTLLHTMCSN